MPLLQLAPLTDAAKAFALTARALAPSAATAENELMMLREKIQEAVGCTYRFALFYRFPGSLRFGLSGGDSPLDQVLTALRRATAVCNDAFLGEERILVHLQAFASASRFSFREMLRELRLAGIVIPSARDVWIDHTDDDDDDGAGHWVNCAFEVPVAKLQNLLWCAVATDFSSLRPNPHCRVYLLNARKGIVCHPYDDRGMDVIGREKSALAELYQRHNDLLLEYDLEVMRQSFEQL